MILVKNKLKKKKIMDDDEYLHYLKYSHLNKPTERRAERSNEIEYEDEATQFPELENRQTQTDKKFMLDKETETGDELNQIIGNYILKMSSKNFKSLEPSRSEKMVEAFTKMIENPSSSSSDSEGNRGFFKRHRGKLKMGFRLAEVAGNTAMMGGSALLSAIDYLSQSPQNDNEETQQQEDVISVNSSPPISIHSSPPQTVVNVSSSSSSHNPPMVAPPTDLPIPTSSSSSSRRSSSASASGSAYPTNKKKK